MLGGTGKGRNTHFTSSNGSNQKASWQKDTVQLQEVKICHKALKVKVESALVRVTACRGNTELAALPVAECKTTELHSEDRTENACFTTRVQTVKST